MEITVQELENLGLKYVFLLLCTRKHINCSALTFLNYFKRNLDVSDITTVFLSESVSMFEMYESSVQIHIGYESDLQSDSFFLQKPHTSQLDDLLFSMSDDGSLVLGFS